MSPLLYMFQVYHQRKACMKPVFLLKDALKSKQVKYLCVIFKFLSHKPRFRVRVLSSLPPICHHKQLDYRKNCCL